MNTTLREVSPTTAGELNPLLCDRLKRGSYVTAPYLKSADRSPFHEEDPTRSRGIKHPGWRTGVPGEASGGICATVSSCAAQWPG